MKSKKSLSIIFLMIVIILITLFVLNKYNKKSIENNILDNKWYSYDNTTGFYDIISFEDGKFLYNKSSSSSKDGVFDSCTKYYYNKFNRSISLDCGIVFEVENFGSSKMSLWVNDRKKTFFLEPNDSLNYEFENYYNYSISEYKKDKKQNTELIKIDTNRLIEVKWNMDVNNSYLTDLSIKVLKGKNEMLNIITKASLKDMYIESIKSIEELDYTLYDITIKTTDISNLDYLKDIKKMKNNYANIINLG